MTLLERLEANSIPEPNSGCKLWLGALVNEHGVIKVAGRTMQAHRVAWEAERGLIPKGLWVMHTCGVGPCINVNHLRLGTPVENRNDLNRPGGYRFFRQYGSMVPIANVPVADSRASTKRLRATDAELDQAELRRILRYEPETGKLFWRPRSDRGRDWNGRFVNEEAGSVLPIGYRYINFNTKLKTAHRVAWCWMTGEWPAHQVDHINGDRADNRWANLRLATQTQNSANQGPRATNTSGVKGVFWDKAKDRWCARIMVAGKSINLGRFKTLEEAAAARRIAEAEHHGSFAHTKGTC